MLARSLVAGMIALATALGASPAIAGTDVLVNDPEPVGSDSSSQFETTIAVDGGQACAGWIDTGGTPGLAGLGDSINGGATWTDRGEIGGGSDPVIAIGRAGGRRYYARIDRIGGGNGIGVSRSDGDCESFAQPVDAAAASSKLATTAISDKPWIAVDNTGGPRDGTVYVCWSRFVTGGAVELRFSRSVDKAATFEAEKVLAPTPSSPFGCNVQVGPAGQVYVAYVVDGGSGRGQVRIVRSLDGGLSFRRPVAVSRSRHPGIDRMVACGGWLRPTLKGDIRQAPQVWLAADTSGGRYRGRLYAVWASDPFGRADNADVYLSRSLDGGLSWLDPVRVRRRDGDSDQFMPNVAIGGSGQLAITWYDRRADPANLRIGLYGTFSLNGGRTLMPPRRISDVTFGVPPLNPTFDPNAAQCHWGEYIGIAADRRRAYYLWADNRRTVVNAQWPGGRPDPDVYSDRLALPPIPSNRFRILQIVRDPDRGRARMIVRVPGSGVVRVRGNRLRNAFRRPRASRRLGVPIVPRRKLAERLEAIGRVTVRVRVGYTPSWGAPRVKRRLLRLIATGAPG